MSGLRDTRVGRIRRSALRAIAIVVTTVGLLAAPASAGSDWDPNNVEGPLDIRWIGATFVTRDDATKITISFYGDFRVSAVPTIERRGYYPKQRGRGTIGIHLTDALTGYFMRRLDGQLIFVYADWGSTCCLVHRVTRPWPGTLRVTFPTLRDPADLTYEVRGWTRWRDGETTILDWTAPIDLGEPPHASRG